MDETDHLKRLNQLVTEIDELRQRIDHAREQERRRIEDRRRTPREGHDRRHATGELFAVSA